MMGEIVSLKQQRKRRERDAREEKAAENRVRFGRSKEDRKLADTLRDKAAKDLDGHKR
ncbi:MAG: DUF4169 family protein [Alphaproteobacteria bacterium]|jgi:hypothetical protein|nr:DUF4169 family protein [Alphaproteobacteria bacterium]